MFLWMDRKPLSLKSVQKTTSLRLFLVKDEKVLPLFVTGGKEDTFLRGRILFVKEAPLFFLVLLLANGSLSLGCLAFFAAFENVVEQRRFAQIQQEGGNCVGKESCKEEIIW